MPEVTHSALSYAIPGEDGDAVRLRGVTTDDGQEQALIETVRTTGRPIAGTRLTKRQLLMLAQAATALANQIPD